MGRMVGDHLPETLKQQLQISMRGFCRPRDVSATLADSESSQDSQRTVPASNSQVAAFLRNPVNGSTELRGDKPPAWASMWAEEIERDSSEETPNWAFQWANEIDEKQVEWQEAEAWAHDLTRKWELDRSRSPRSRAPSGTNWDFPVSKPVDTASVLPSVGTLLDKAKTACYLNSRAKVAADDCHRVVKSGTKISEITDAASLLLSVNLYGPPHVTKAHMNKGKVTGILVKPNFGGSVSIYLRTGKIIVDGNAQTKAKLVNLLSGISAPASASASVSAELPSVEAVRAKLPSM